MKLDWQGEEVDEFQRLCAVQSDKATIEITSRYKGKVSQILHVPGDIVKVILRKLLFRKEIIWRNLLFYPCMHGVVIWAVINMFWCHCVN